MLVLVTINDLPAYTFINSGANTNILNKSYTREWKIPLRRKRNLYELILANGELINSDNRVVSEEAIV